MVGRRQFVTGAAATVALAGRVLGAVVAPSSGDRIASAPLGSVVVGGDLRKRAKQNMARLEEEQYRPPMVFAGVNAKSWPGDIEGRALLGITLLARSTGEEPAYLRAMFAEYKARLAGPGSSGLSSGLGYFGEPLDVHAINEQQLSGHGWLLRGLCEYYAYTGDPDARKMVERIVAGLALPLRGKYAAYPIDPAVRTHGGGVDGSITARQGDWVLSSDIGCAFIFVDGLAHAWTITRQPELKASTELKALIDEAIARFLQVDLIAMQAQTHATLTCMRALLRVYGETGDPALLRAVAERYKLYRTTAMTEHYANYNWFQRPETWTEPCAIIDSFMIAHQMWGFTGEASYLEDAHRIWFNGVGRGMRGNGGFGTDLCAGYKTPFIKVRSYEAYFCCTMRGGEGHARAIEYLYSTAGDEVTLAHFSDSQAKLEVGGGVLEVRQGTSYPDAGQVRLEVVSSSCRRAVRVRMFAPQWTSGHRLTVNGKAVPTAVTRGFVTATLKPKAGDVVVLDCTLRVGPRETLNARSIQGYYAFEAGPMMLGYDGTAEVHVARNAALEKVGEGRYRVAGSAVELSRINDMNDLHVGPKEPCTRQVLFREA